MHQLAPGLGGTRIDQRAAGVERASVALHRRSLEFCADVGTARLIARGAWRGRDARPVNPREIKVPEPWRLST
jgi:hypothetical protein